MKILITDRAKQKNYLYGKFSKLKKIEAFTKMHKRITIKKSLLNDYYNWY
jgi:hypothetical protein